MHIVNWFGVCYFDQIYLVWFMQIAAVSSLSHAGAIKTDRVGLFVQPQDEAETSLDVPNQMPDFKV